ncbi:MAG: ATP-binding cassette domain-containing protein [Acidobacteria bacterium]|nr:ATP-binding cassette domain-containing protein [Acidobacteriota bacterium]
MIEVRNLERRFGEVVAVDGVSFTAADGRITGLLGPNGAGKTTTLRTLYGLLRPDAGAATIDGIDAVAEPLAVQRRIGVLPDAHGLYVRLTVREHLRYVGELHGLDGDAIASSIERLVARLDMGAIIDRRVEGFSTGERMKVAVGRALVHDPPNLLLDEPTRGLDVMSTRAMRDLIRQLRADGKCVLFSSHVMQEVSALCDEIVIVARGRAVAHGTPDELCQRAGEDDLEEAFVRIIGSDEGLQ